MLYFYLVAAAVLIPFLDRFTGILHTPNSWWICPLLYIGFAIGLIALHFLVVVTAVQLVNVNKPAERFSRFYRKAISLTLPMFFKMAGVHIHTDGLDKVPQDTRFLFVCNHLDNFDPVVIMSVLPDAELGFVGKKEIYEKMKFVSKAMHKLHGLPIDRENNREAAKTIIKAVNLIKEDKVSIGIFPEGYASTTGELLPMRNGAFKIAYKADVPIVVAAISGTKKIAKNMFRRRTDVYFDVLEVIPRETLGELNSTELGDKVTEIMFEGTKIQREKLEK